MQPLLFLLDIQTGKHSEINVARPVRRVGDARSRQRTGWLHAGRRFAYSCCGLSRRKEVQESFSRGIAHTGNYNRYHVRRARDIFGALRLGTTVTGDQVSSLLPMGLGCVLHVTLSSNEELLRRPIVCETTGWGPNELCKHRPAVRRPSRNGSL
jgi:hypothetical protein